MQPLNAVGIPRLQAREDVKGIQDQTDRPIRTTNGGHRTDSGSVGRSAASAVNGRCIDLDSSAANTCEAVTPAF